MPVYRTADASKQPQRPVPSCQPPSTEAVERLPVSDKEKASLYFFSFDSLYVSPSLLILTLPLPLKSRSSEGQSR
jgi:hypothetical protein